MSITNRPESVTRIDTRLENFLSRQSGYQEIEVYEQEACIEEIVGTPKFLKKYPFRVLIVSKDKIFITDNPPRNLDNFVCFEDILEIKLLDDIPRFLKGALQKDSLHLSISYFDNPNKKSDLIELKKRVVNLKKNMLYSRVIDEKLQNIELNAPLSFRNENMSTFRSMNFDFSTMESVRVSNRRSDLFETRKDPNMLTNRTLKSVHFDDDTNNKVASAITTIPESAEEGSESKKQIARTDTLTKTATQTRYQKLLDLTARTSLSNNSENEDPLSLSLPLPLSHRLAGNSLDDEVTFMPIEVSKSMDEMNNKHNIEFMHDTDKKPTVMDLYILNPKSKMFQTLKSAHFYSKIRGTLNFHQNNDQIQDKKAIANKIKNQSLLSKNFLQIKEEIKLNVDDLVKTYQLFDELMCATNSHSTLKKYFWQSHDFYTLIVNQMIRYLPKSPANMKLGTIKAAERRINELECCIGLIECLSMMISETEFYQNRNEILSNKKCQLLARFVPVLIEDPELAVLHELDFNEKQMELNLKMKKAVSDISLVSAILLWEILTFLKLNSWSNDFFNFDTCIKMIEESKSLSVFIQRLIGELIEIITYNSNIMLSAQQTVIIYKVFNLLESIITSNSSKKILIKLLRQDYQEEFKYYFSEKKVKSRCFDYYPIIEELLSTVRKLEGHIV